uniref:Uncharacterized protein n=1 Tax=Candidatus Kentrum sp. MB TaxID=2138164 RepID=A0A450XUK7_9GAMM|nr:MAG: hypothetical protein BECKMB1821I_GA0114274_103826 [Candidatus Kentron sp. MB]VFK75821.1 MAG: hypothetical protein BECKMB1821H_GA0114242_103230 [Candidatus Kentron sp. MB]
MRFPQQQLTDTKTFVWVYQLLRENCISPGMIDNSFVMAFDKNAISMANTQFFVCAWAYF